MLAKRALCVDEIEDLLRHRAGGPPAAIIRSGPNAWVIDVAALTSGIFMLLHRLLDDAWQSDLAEETAQALVTGAMLDYGSFPTCEGPSRRWGQIRTIEECQNHLDDDAFIARVPQSNERRRPPMAHNGVCHALDIDRVEQHLRDHQGAQYFWAHDLDVARQVLRARRCFSQHRRQRP